MALSEFEIIKKFFASQKITRSDVILGIGDDCAVLHVPENFDLAVTIDSLVADIHFPPNSNAFDLGYKALAINLSDLAAMGGIPAWFTLALTLPKADEHWLTDFANGLFNLATQYNMQLVGGNLTHGPLAITIQAHGFVPTNKALRRSTANINDKIYVTGHLGSAAFGLRILQKTLVVKPEDHLVFIEAFTKPNPRIQEGLFLRDIATAVIDISDGLASDLNHILEASQVGATLHLAQVPIDSKIQKYLSIEDSYRLALTGGEDYELCFTVSPEKEQQYQEWLKNFSCIGMIEQKVGLRILDDKGKLFTLSHYGYQHF